MWLVNSKHSHTSGYMRVCPLVQSHYCISIVYFLLSLSKSFHVFSVDLCRLYSCWEKGFLLMSHLHSFLSQKPSIWTGICIFIYSLCICIYHIIFSYSMNILPTLPLKYLKLGSQKICVTKLLSHGNLWCAWKRYTSTLKERPRCCNGLKRLILRGGCVCLELCLNLSHIAQLSPPSMRPRTMFQQLSLTTLIQWCLPMSAL